MLRRIQPAGASSLSGGVAALAAAPSHIHVLQFRQEDEMGLAFYRTHDEPSVPPRGILPHVAWLSLALAAACTGTIPGGGGGNDDDVFRNDDTADDTGLPPGIGGPPPPPAPGPSFSCSTDAVPLGTPLRRLSRRQYENTLQDLLTNALGASEAQKVMTALSGPLKGLPEDRMPSLGHGAEGPSYRRIDQQVLDAHVEAAYDLSLEVGKALSEPARLGKLLGACGVDNNKDNDADCLRSFVKSFGSRALRTDLPDEDVAFYQNTARNEGGPVSGSNFANVVAGLLLSPRFLYHVEGEGSQVAERDDIYSLTAAELAGRLSYHFWDTLPDEELWNAALDGSLMKSEVFTTQLDRIVSDPRSRATLQNFYREWLDLEDIPQLDVNKDQARFKAFAKDNLPSANLHEAMAQELVDLTDHLTWTAVSNANTLLTTNASFTRSAELSKLYSGPQWDGGDSPPSFSSGERPGILSRAGRLVNASGATRPIMRGVFVRRNILCDELVEPPPGAVENLPMLDPNLSGRQVVEELTEKTPACAGCHKALLNPIGYVLEGFDGLGRKRTQETVFDSGGNVLATHSIDDVAVAYVADDDEREVQGAEGLAQAIVDSGKLSACLARQYFRFAMARREDPDRDGCMLERIRRGFAGESLQAGLRAVATDASFWRRSF